MQFIRVDEFSELEEEFHTRVQEMVWCSVATVDTNGHPRSRVLHPIWEGHIGWIATSPKSVKATHLAKTPYVSVAYLKDPFKPVYADCEVEWVQNMDEKQRIWDLFNNTPEPYGYDLASFFGTVDSEHFGLMKLTPKRIEVYTLGVESKIWKPS